LSFSRFLLTSGFACLQGLGSACMAAHPLQTEDTATQGAGNFEMENGAARTRSGSNTDVAAQVQVSYGLTPTFDLLLQPSWAQQRTLQDRVQGFGDTHADFKWRFFGEAPYSLALRAGVTWPTAQRELGLPKGTTSAHAIVVATYDAAPFTFHANVGYARWPLASGKRRDARHVSTALMWAANDSFTFTAELAADTDSDPLRSRWPVNALTGLIWTLQPGLDLDVGFQSTARVTPAARSWLLGLTWRFAL
jgi:hypothetical protein